MGDLDMSIPNYINITARTDLTPDEIKNLESIQQTHLPIERVDPLLEFKYAGKITNDEFETMTGLPYSFTGT